MGAHFHLSIRSLQWQGIKEYLGLDDVNRRLRLYLADADSGFSYTSADFTSPVALVVGGEAAGAGEDARLLSDDRVHIPIPGPAESLNAGIAAGVLLFEVVRQRKMSRST
jgi:tRNA G18 (ribose-2'-O)-methylase SpoU